MENLLEKVLYTGVGAVSLTVEKIQGTVNKLVDENKISAEEGKKIVDDLVKKSEVKKEEIETKLKEVSESVVSKFNYPTRADYDALVKRVEALEAEAAKKKTVKKSGEPAK